VVTATADESAQTAAFRRALADPSVLPSDLSVRFLVVVLVILASTASIYGYLGLKSEPATESRAAACLSGTGYERMSSIEVGIMRELVGTTRPVLACVAPEMGRVLLWQAAGVVLVLGAGWLSYRVAPMWRLAFPNRFRRLVTGRAKRGRLYGLAGYDAEAAGAVHAIAERLELAPAPRIVVDPHGQSSYVFGTNRRPVVCLSGDLVRRRRDDPTRFTAVVLHELAHLKNRDNRPTHLTTATWWSFVALAVVPYAALLVAPRLLYDPLGWRPTDLDASVANLHTTVAVATLVAVVYLTWLGTLRTRELDADATVGRHDPDGVMLDYVRRPGLESPSRLPVFLRTHPALRQRRDAIRDPANLPSLSFAQLFGAGVGVAVLSQNLGNVAWHALMAAGYPAVPSPRTTFDLLAVNALGNLAPVAAVAWLAGVVAWRARLRALVRPERAPTLRLGLGLGLGLVAGGPAAVASANASRWGVFDGVGDGTVSGALVSVLVLVGLLLALSRWSWDNAGVWLPVVRRSVRSACAWGAAAATLAVLPWYAVWWVMHDVPLIGRAYIWTPSFAAMIGADHATLPWSEWLQVTYIPGDLLAWGPGVAVLAALPMFAFAAGMLRRPGPSTPDWLGQSTENAAIRPPDLRPHVRSALRNGAVAGAAALTAGFALAWWAHANLDRPPFADAPIGALLRYLRAVADLVVAATAGVAAGFTALRARTAGVTFGALTALVVAGLGAFATPLIVLAATCGPASAVTCPGGRLTGVYSVLYGFSGTAQPVKGLVAGLAVAGVVTGGRDVVRMVRRAPGRSPAVAARTPEPRLSAVLVGCVLAVGLLAGAVFGASAHG
jgi:Zn-dependent protease with chaperone function